MESRGLCVGADSRALLAGEEVSATPPVDLLEGAIRRARIAERIRCAEIAAQYPLEGFCYDTNNHGEILRLRDTISEAILKSAPGERIK